MGKSTINHHVQAFCMFTRPGIQNHGHRHSSGPGGVDWGPGARASAMDAARLQGTGGTQMFWESRIRWADSMEFFIGKPWNSRENLQETMVFP